ncbi:unnamed protein product [Linum tenue]|uniref:FAD-binding PCMH-type domain-containing protein n=1 Tax=Linum tenue TaxID=586396 RepID=A0AAV0QJK8_9ROSI|nr:unnamed protein product [Linum tenue]
MLFTTVLFLVITTSLFSAASIPTPNHGRSFQQCFYSHYSNNHTQVVIPRNSPLYSPLLNSSIRNNRFVNSSSFDSWSKPEFIVTPTRESHIQATIICAKRSGFQVRTRSGGHDYEGLSYSSSTHQKFVLVDLSNFRSIEVDIENEIAWVETGATLGELYYRIAEKSRVHGFPAGSCPTVGVGGHFSGGGFGTIFRKYGLAADRVMDARIVDANGEIMDRNSMGEDLFWAIRGGGGASFGVILAWKVELVPVPEIVTIFSVSRIAEQGGVQVFQKWQNVSHNLPKELFLHAVIKPNNGTIQFVFVGLFLGRVKELLPLMEERFPELGLAAESSQEVSWIQSVMYFAGFAVNNISLKALLNRTSTFDGFFKAKSDYAREPISGLGLEGLFKRVLEQESSMLILTPYGGRTGEIPDSETPFPHRRGYIYMIQYIVTWDTEEETSLHMRWIRELYEYMAPYVSKAPRAAYYNYRDLDLGRNGKNDDSYERARIWGLKYFNGNFDRLVRVKTAVDPSNFFWNEQSIPVLAPH